MVNSAVTPVISIKEKIDLALRGWRDFTRRVAFENFRARNTLIVVRPFTRVGKIGEFLAAAGETTAASDH